MLDWQIPIYLQAQAVIIEVEGMKAANQERSIDGNHCLQYDEKAFDQKAAELNQLAQDIRP